MEVLAEKSSFSGRSTWEFCGIKRGKDSGQFGFCHLRGRLGRAEPAAAALPMFGIDRMEFFHRDRVDRNDAGLCGAIVKDLVIGEKPNAVRDQATFDASLFKGFPRGAFATGLSFHRPALRNDPAASVTAGDQQDLGRMLGLVAKAKRGILGHDRLRGGLRFVNFFHVLPEALWPRPHFFETCKYTPFYAGVFDK